MPFELVMLLGFFGAGLLGLLPEGAREGEDAGFRHRSRGEHTDAGRRPAVPHYTSRAAGVKTERASSRPRRESRAAA